MSFWCRARTRVIEILRIGGGLGARPPAHRGLVPGPGPPHLTLSRPWLLSAGPSLGGGGDLQVCTPCPPLELGSCV